MTALKFKIAYTQCNKRDVYQLTIKEPYSLIPSALL